ncbi:hypothetical protein LIER_21497 [Lithospermum erythrorhizon]|uniref:Uncharacterized protein n=1 Tax=Lithospermum erythrorhizon TaxID=34254 RepID=A0AAV3QQL1_LITER
MKDYEGIECPHKDPLVITTVITNFEVGRMLVDIGSSMDILFLDAYLKLMMSRAHIRPVATPVVGFTRVSISPLGDENLLVTMGKHPQQATKMVEFTVIDMNEGAYNGIIDRPALVQFEAMVSLINL